MFSFYFTNDNPKAAMDDQASFLDSLRALPRDEREKIERYFRLFPGRDFHAVLAHTLLLGMREVEARVGLLSASPQSIAGLLQEPRKGPRAEPRRAERPARIIVRENRGLPEQQRPKTRPVAPAGDQLLECVGYSGKEMDGVRATFETADRHGFGRLPWKALQRLAPVWLSAAQMDHSYWLGGRDERQGVDLTAFCQLHFLWCKCDSELVGGFRRLFDAHATGHRGSMKPRDLRRLLLQQPYDVAARLVESEALLQALNLTRELARSDPTRDEAGVITFCEFASLFGGAEAAHRCGGQRAVAWGDVAAAAAAADLGQESPRERELDLRGERLAAQIFEIGPPELRGLQALWRQLADRSGTVSASAALRAVLLASRQPNETVASRWAPLLFVQHGQGRLEQFDGIVALGAMRRWSADHVARLRRVFEDAAGGRSRALLRGLLAAAHHAPASAADLACLRHLLGWPVPVGASSLDDCAATDALSYSEWLLVAAQLERWQESSESCLSDPDLRRCKVVAGLFRLSDSAVEQAWRGYSCCDAGEDGASVPRRELEAACSAMLRAEGRGAEAAAAALLEEHAHYSFSEMLALVGALTSFGSTDVHRAYSAFQREDADRRGRLSPPCFSRALEGSGCHNADEPELLRAVRLLSRAREGGPDGRISFLGLLLAMAVHRRHAGAWVDFGTSPSRPPRASASPSSPSKADMVFKASLRPGPVSSSPHAHERTGIRL